MVQMDRMSTALIEALDRRDPGSQRSLRELLAIKAEERGGRVIGIDQEIDPNMYYVILADRFATNKVLAMWEFAEIGPAADFSRRPPDIIDAWAGLTVASRAYCAVGRGPLGLGILEEASLPDRTD